MQVMSANQPGPLLLVVDLPSLAHLEALQQQNTLAPWLPFPGAAPGTQEGVQAKGGAAGVQEGVHCKGATSGVQGVAQGSPGSSRVCVITHMGPAAVVAHPSYQAWLASMGPGVQHVLGSSGGAACTLRRATVLQVCVVLTIGGECNKP